MTTFVCTNPAEECYFRTDAEKAALPPVRVEADVGLLPCPFCGGRAEMNHGGFGECFVTCANDNCGGRLGCGIWFTTVAQAMDVWNRRHNEKDERRA
jgi:hypothetical protein